MQSDVIIVGAGPAGLCLAQALKPLDLRVTIIEQAPLGTVQAMAAPEFNAVMQRRFANRLGAMTLANTRHVYPLAGQPSGLPNHADGGEALHT